MKRRRLVAMAMTAACFSPIMATAAPTLINGDFETPFFPLSNCFTGTSGAWTSTSPIADTSCYIPAVYPDPPVNWPGPQAGQQYMYLNNHGSSGTALEQTVDLAAGETYILSFFLAGLSGPFDWLNQDPVIEVFAGSQSTVIHGKAGPFWNSYSWTFTELQGGGLPIGFRSISGTANLDSVSLTTQAIPEPNVAVLLAAGLLASGASMLRVRRKSPPALS